MVAIIDEVRSRKQQAKTPVTEKTAELLAKYVRESNEDRKRLIESQIVRLNQGLVKTVVGRAKENVPNCLTLDDLFNVGVRGLLKAIERFDASRNCAFSSYAVPWIRGEIQHYLRDYTPDSGIKIRRQSREVRAEVRQKTKARCQRGQVVSEEFVALTMGIEPEEWAQIVAETSRLHIISLDSRDSASDEPLQLEAPEEEEELAPDPEREAVRGKLVWAIARVPNPKARHCLELFHAGWEMEAIANQSGASVTEVEHLIQIGITAIRSKLHLNHA
ncbi:sigma-70 family RNA polymerase sigma factor [Leptolyngbya sp. FACHB-16]|uniref:sigma-70 family RNA polymerase sigma factor n=1 Tax=unclassified Leptolyngbya TaxID=2650499 RepID=UPI001685A08F|nr:sigma-70 family RNA polymerase sigma factor [Leptolyngbya sp. FACHB-16]MBD2156218.1 sigma-70 family RNA polymerase sigma factor [Leptolyngbya sp. FACHB-16]